MFKLKIPPDVKFRSACVPQIAENIKVICDSEERIFDKTYVTAVMNNRLVKFLKESVSYK